MIIDCAAVISKRPNAHVGLKLVWSLLEQPDNVEAKTVRSRYRRGPIISCESRDYRSKNLGSTKILLQIEYKWKSRVLGGAECTISSLIGSRHCVDRQLRCRPVSICSRLDEPPRFSGSRTTAVMLELPSSEQLLRCAFDRDQSDQQQHNNDGCNRMEHSSAISPKTPSRSDPRARRRTRFHQHPKKPPQWARC